MIKPLDINLQDRCFHFNFAEYFSIDVPSEYELFDISPKRSYISSIDNLKIIINEITQNVPEFPTMYFSAKFSLHNEELNQTLIESVISNILDERVISVIHQYVETHYIPVLDEETKRSKIKNTELQFTDAHAKIVLETATAIRLLIPLICHYHSLKGTNTFSRDFIYIMKLYSKLYNVNLYNKFYKLTESRVRGTQYSDIVFWSFSESLAMDMTTTIKNIVENIIRDIFYKLDYERSIISMIHACLKNQLDYIIRNNYQVKFTPVHIRCSEDNDVNPFDRVDTAFQHDESLSVLSSLNIESTIRSLEKRFGKVSEDVLSQVTANININPVQTNILFMFVSYYAECSYDLLYNCSKRQYCKFVILMDSYFKRLNLMTLNRFLLSKPIPLKRKTSLPKKFVKDVLTSSSFNEFIQTKFSLMSQRIIESDIIFKIITNLSKNEFVCIFTDEQLVITHEAVTSEFISFIRSIS